MNRTIEIVISPEGETVIETKGFAGSSCRDATKRLEKALGNVTQEQLTTECYLNDVTERQSTNEE